MFTPLRSLQLKHKIGIVCTPDRRTASSRRIESNHIYDDGLTCEHVHETGGMHSLAACLPAKASYSIILPKCVRPDIVFVLHMRMC